MTKDVMCKYDSFPIMLCVSDAVLFFVTIMNDNDDDFYNKKVILKQSFELIFKFNVNDEDPEMTPRPLVYQSRCDYRDSPALLESYRAN